MKQKALVVGSGIAGIAASIRLAVKGYEVAVYEKNSYPGGKLTAFEQSNFRFDAGPSLFTLPELVDDLFKISGKNPRDYFNYQACEISCNYFFEDGQKLSFYADHSKLFHEIESKLQVDSSNLNKYLKKSKQIYESTEVAFLKQSLHDWKNYFTKAVLRCIKNIPFLNLNTTMHAANENELNHEKLVQIFDRYATYNGSNPYKAPGILNLIPHLELSLGSYFPTNGMHSITKALVLLAQDLGVQFNFNSEVQEIIIAKKEVTGIKVANKHIDSKIVICNSDVKFAYTHLIRASKKKMKYTSQEPSSSGCIFYWGINATFPELDLHNILFSKDYKNEFETIFSNNDVCDDPTIYINITSKKSKRDAPENCENWFVMVNVPYNSGQNWEELRQKIRDSIIQKINRMLNTTIEKYIVTENYLDPIKIEKNTSSFGGALYGASSNNKLAAFFRHPNFTPTKGLFFCGGSVHPGGGIPLCLNSAEIATNYC
jgi:diapolycopene oxygenase